MRVATGIQEVDALTAKLVEALPPPVVSVSDLPADAECARVSHKTAGLLDLRHRVRLRQLGASGFDDECLRVVGRIASLEHLQLMNLKVSDLRAISGLRRLRTLSISVGSRLKSLDGIETLRHLELFSAWHVPRLASIQAVERLAGLRVLFLAGGMYRPIRVPSLAPLAGARGLLSLTLSGFRVADRSLAPLAHLRSVRILELPLHFAAEEFKTLATALPHARGTWRSQLE
ncbi:MAG TPA: leucine-rich repeat domain-containing protein [Vicinamibacterales bacterium]|nr:leucine-rich repeat domain-containing protein [Vicinamibacterales bacterium]